MRLERMTRRRRERAITRLTARMDRLEREIDLLAAQAGPLDDGAHAATVDAALRPDGPALREADRASAARASHQRLLADRRAELAGLRRRRDDLLDRL